MIGLAKKYSIVIMDGSDDEVVDNITGVINMITKEFYGEAVCRSLDCDHPTMIVVEFITSKRKFRVIQELLELIYPNLCIFNPIV